MVYGIRDMRVVEVGCEGVRLQAYVNSKDNDLTMTSSYLHVDFVVLPKDKVPTNERGQEVVHRVIPPTQLPQQVQQRLVYGGEEGQVPGVLEGRSEYEL